MLKSQELTTTLTNIIAMSRTEIRNFTKIIVLTISKKRRLPLPRIPKMILNKCISIAKRKVSVGPTKKIKMTIISIRIKNLL